MFKITITDLKTGKVEVDTESKCIIAGFDDSKKEGSTALTLARCNGPVLVSVIRTARKAIEETFSKALKEE